uniref:Kunitz peptide n=1 Tax=Calliophis bivirgatus TaxID=8633 RepID=A0A898INF0_CALBG|nr:kunitz peptide [Calliophis bivirgatus]
MSSGSLLLLLGLLTLWAELTPVSSRIRPKFCDKFFDFYHCLRENAFYYNRDSKKCQPFLFGGCKNNLNNFKTREACERTCVE